MVQSNNPALSSPGGSFITLFELSLMGGGFSPGRLPAEIVRVPWSGYNVIPSKNYSVVGAISLTNVSHTTILADLIEHAIELGGHDIINVRLSMAADGRITGATAVAIRYTDETISVDSLASLSGSAGVEDVSAQNNPLLSFLPGSNRGAARQANDTPVYSQQRSRVNWLSADGTFAGGGVRYERDINNLFAIGGNVLFNWFPPDVLVIGVAGTARLFFGGSPFYAEIGVGFGFNRWEEEEFVPGRWVSTGGGSGYHTQGYYAWRDKEQAGFMIAPAVGARLGGRTRGFFANPFVSVPIVIGGAVRPRIGVGLGGAW